LQSQRGLSPESQALLLKLMTEAIPGAKRLEGALRAGTLAAIPIDIARQRQHPAAEFFLRPSPNIVPHVGIFPAREGTKSGV
jgi:hypothetical protein